MADVLVSISTVSADGKRQAIDTWLPSGTTLAQAQGWLTGQAPLIDAITGAKILDANVSFPLTLPGGLKSSADVSSTNHRGGLFGFDNPSPYKWSQYIGALLPALIIGEDVNVGDTDVAAYLAAMEDGITVSGTPIQPTNQYGDDLTANVSAKAALRK
ncbi:MAG TPA: hypothetical protein VKH37_07335 [Ferruginibacter sp.]|nr:hypothetical protein [Ferruginibacter sp.]